MNPKAEHLIQAKRLYSAIKAEVIETFAENVEVRQATLSLQHEKELDRVVISLLIEVFLKEGFELRTEQDTIIIKW